MDASGAVVGDCSKQFIFDLVRLGLCLAEPFLASDAFWPRLWKAILIMKLLIGGHPPIYRTSVLNLPIWSHSLMYRAVVALVPRDSVGP